MPTTVITGRDVTFTLDTATYDAQATSAVLSCETIIETYQTLDGRAYTQSKQDLRSLLAGRPKYLSLNKSIYQFCVPT